MEPISSSWLTSTPALGAPGVDPPEPPPPPLPLDEYPYADPHTYLWAPLVEPPPISTAQILAEIADREKLCET